MVRTLPFRITVAGLAKLRAVAQNPQLSLYVRKLEFCTHWKGDLRFEEYTIGAIKKIERGSHNVIIRKLLRHGSLAFPHVKDGAIRAVTHSFNNMARLELLQAENDMSYDLVVEYIHLSIPQFRYLQSVVIFENGLRYEWQIIPGRISISQVTSDKPTTVLHDSDEFETSHLARSVLETIVSASSKQTTACEIIWRTFDPWDESLTRHDLGKCLDMLKSAFNRISVRFLDLDPDTDIVRRYWNRNIEAFADSNVSHVVRRDLLEATVGKLRNLEEVELIFSYETSLCKPRIASRSPDSRDYLCNYIYLKHPMLLFGTPHLHKLHIEAAAILQEQFAELLVQTSGTLRDLTLVSIEWMQEASLFLWFEDFQQMHGHLERAILRGVHKEIGQRRFINMDGSFPRGASQGPGQGSADCGGPWTVGDSLGTLCTSDSPIDYINDVLYWLGESLPPSKEQISKWDSIKELLNF